MVHYETDIQIDRQQLIMQDGGSFDGSFNVDFGLAIACDPEVFKNLPSFTITGNLNVAMKEINLTIKGKVYI